jgi:hypothetical protein
MVEKHCTKCGAEFMMSEHFNICGYCKTPTLVIKGETTTSFKKVPSSSLKLSAKKWWEFWK